MTRISRREFVRGAVAGAVAVAAAGLDVPTEFVGDDLRPLLAGKPWRKDRPVFSVIHHRLPFSRIMWRRGDYKLVGFPTGRRTGGTGYSLFNVSKDPWELTDLGDDPASAAVLKRMKAELLDYWRPLAKLLPGEMPPSVRGRPHRFTWPTDPWKPVKPV